MAWIFPPVNYIAESFYLSPGSHCLHLQRSVLLGLCEAVPVSWAAIWYRKKMYEFSWILVYEFVIIRLQSCRCVCMSLHEFLCMHIVWACTHGINKKREIEDPTVWTKKNCVLFPLFLCLSVTHYLSLFLCVLLPSIYLFLSPSLSSPLSLSSFFFCKSAKATARRKLWTREWKIFAMVPDALSWTSTRVGGSDSSAVHTE